MQFLCAGPRLLRPSWRRTAGGGTGLHRAPSRGRSASGGWEAKAILFRGAKALKGPAENSRRRPIAVPGLPTAVAPMRRPKARLHRKQDGKKPRNAKCACSFFPANLHRRRNSSASAALSCDDIVLACCSRPNIRRSLLKSSSMGWSGRTSTPLLAPRSVNVANAPAPAGSSSHTTYRRRRHCGNRMAARCAADRPAIADMLSKIWRTDNMVSMPSPATMTDAAGPKRTPLPSKLPIARREQATGALSTPAGSSQVRWTPVTVPAPSVIAETIAGHSVRTSGASLDERR